MRREKKIVMSETFLPLTLRRHKESARALGEIAHPTITAYVIVISNCQHLS